MSNYRIFTDTGCDISPELLAAWDVRCVELVYRFEGEDREYINADMPAVAFYNRMRHGECVRTAAANIADFTTAFEPVLRDGSDVLYLAFSSGLSTTFHSAGIAASELREKYPERHIYIVDTLCASAGLGMMVYMASQNREHGMSAEENARYVEEKRLSLCHWFTVDDLAYLKRGGRVSAAAAVAGSVLGIKPILHMDNEGHLILMHKIRGRKQAIRSMAEKYMELAKDPAAGPVFISHGDCPSDAVRLDDHLFEMAGIRASVITDIGPVIGAHSGPGTLALFFSGRER